MKKVAALQEVHYPGVAIVDEGEKLRVIPDEYRDGHEAHFGEVAARFFEYLRDPKRFARLGEAEHAGEVLHHDRRLEISSRNMTASR